MAWMSSRAPTPLAQGRQRTASWPAFRHPAESPLGGRTGGKTTFCTFGHWPELGLCPWCSRLR